jgi:endonuclease YncB( thermonuclease family)
VPFEQQKLTLSVPGRSSFIRQTKSVRILNRTPRITWLFAQECAAFLSRRDWLMMMASPGSFTSRSWRAVFVVGLAGFLQPAGAEDAKPPAACRFESLGADSIDRGRVSAVVDGRTFVLEDGRELRLAGIEVPAAMPGTHDAPVLTAAQAAKTELQQLISGREVALKRLGAEADRYGRRLVHVLVAREDAQLWAQRIMVARGHARVAARLDPDCAKELLPAERAARAAGLGLWSDPHFGLRPAEKPADILGDRGRFALVEGKIISVRESGGTVYLNFGRRWTRDFAVTVPKRNERLFTAAGIELKKLEGRRVRIRGWVEERGGPRIEAHGPEQIEIAERN